MSKIKSTIKTFIFCSVFFISIKADAGQTGVTLLSLNEAIEISMQNNRDILIARQELKKAEQQIREVRAVALPKITLHNFYTRNLQKPAFFLAFDGDVQKIEIGTDNSIQSLFTVDQLLYSGGQTGTAIRIARIYSESFSEVISQTEKNVKLQVKQQFLSLHLGKELLKINNRTLEQAQSHFNQVNILFGEGAASEFDLLRAEVRVANSRPKVISAENDLLLNMDVLKNILGMPLDRELEITGTLSPLFISVSELNQVAENTYMNRGDYRSLELTRESIAGRVKIESSGWYPELNFNYSFQFQGQSNTFRFGSTARVNSQSATIDLRIPIFDGFQTSARVQQAKIEEKEMDFQLLKLKGSIEIQIRKSRNRMNDARQRIDALSKAVEQAQKAFNIAQVRFDSGQGIQLELFDAQVALEMAQLNTLQSVFDYEFAKAQWENAVGR